MIALYHCMECTIVHQTTVYAPRIVRCFGFKIYDDKISFFCADLCADMYSCVPDISVHRRFIPYWAIAIQGVLTPFKRAYTLNFSAWTHVTHQEYV